MQGILVAEEFIAFQINCDRKTVLSPRYPPHASSAAYLHVFRQRNFRRHHQPQQDLITFFEFELGIEKRSPRADVLRESTAFRAGLTYRDRNCQMEVKPLRRSALELNRLCAHAFSPLGWRFVWQVLYSSCESLGSSKIHSRSRFALVGCAPAS